MQLIDIAVKFRYKNAELMEPFLVLNGAKRYIFGDRIDGNFGLINTELDERFWKYFCLMALRRYYDVNQGWVSAKDLNDLFDSKKSPDAQSVKKYFSRRISRYDQYATADNLPNTHLIQYFPKGLYDVILAGVSKGPYRVSLGVPQLHLNPQECWSYILGPERYLNITPSTLTPDVLDKIKVFSSEGRLVETRLLLIQSLGNFFLENKDKNLQLISDLWMELADTEMILGLSGPAILSAENAIKIYRKIGRNNYSIGRCLRIKADAYGQLNRYSEAIGVLKFGEALLKGSASSSIDKTDLLSHVLVNRGKFVSLVGNYSAANKILRKAKDKAMSGHSIGSIATMDLRLAQHFIRNQEWAQAENSLSNVYGYEKQLSLSEYALFLRSVSDFFLRTKQWDEARSWCIKSIEYGIKHSLQNHMRQINNITGRLKEFGQWEDERSLVVL